MHIDSEPEFWMISVVGSFVLMMGAMKIRAKASQKLQDPMGSIATSFVAPHSGSMGVCRQRDFAIRPQAVLLLGKAGGLDWLLG